MKNRTQNFCEAELFYMQERKKSKADEIGKRVPYLDEDGMFVEE